MKIKHILAALFVILLIGCSATEIEENETNEIEEIIKPETKEEPANNIVVEIPDEEPEEIENIVFIKDKGLSPDNLTINKGNAVTWVVDVTRISNNQPRSIACYKDGTRIFKSERMTEQGQSDSYTFEEPGEYMCQEFIYGKRSTIHVKNTITPLTGAFIGVVGEVNIFPLILILTLLGLGAMYIHEIRTDSV